MPALAVVNYGHGHVCLGQVETPVETMVDGLRRVQSKEALSEDYVRVRAFVPPEFQRNLRDQGRLVDGDHVWCYAYVAHNKKSLAPFMASGDLEWIATEES